MKLSKPEEMDEMGEPGEEQPEPPESGVQTVELFGDEMEIGAAVELIGDMVGQPSAFGIAEEETVRDLQERVEQQERAIAELAEAVEILAQNQGKMAHDDEGADPTVALEADRLDGIYDPTQEFEDGE